MTNLEIEKFVDEKYEMKRDAWIVFAGVSVLTAIYLYLWI